MARDHQYYEVVTNTVADAGELLCTTSVFRLKAASNELSLFEEMFFPDLKVNAEFIRDIYIGELYKQIATDYHQAALNHDYAVEHLNKDTLRLIDSAERMALGI